jgi:hypothetical protein
MRKRCKNHGFQTLQWAPGVDAKTLTQRAKEMTSVLTQSKLNQLSWMRRGCARWIRLVSPSSDNQVGIVDVIATDPGEALGNGPHELVTAPRASASYAARKVASTSATA